MEREPKQPKAAEDREREQDEGSPQERLNLIRTQTAKRKDEHRRMVHRKK